MFKIKEDVKKGDVGMNQVFADSCLFQGTKIDLLGLVQKDHTKPILRG